MKRMKAGKRICTLLLILCVAAAAGIGYLDYRVPSDVSVYRSGEALSAGAFVQLTYAEGDGGAQDFYVTERVGQASLFGVLPLKDVTVTVCDRISVYPGGSLFGVQVYTRGVMIVGLTSVNTENRTCSPAHDAGLRAKDILLSINGTEVNTVEEVTHIVEGSEGQPMEITYSRGGEESSLSLCAVKSGDGMYRAGMWIRDSSAGIGTVTFVMEDGSSFAGLGHGICDTDTGLLLPLRAGNVTDVIQSGIAKGMPGQPGEIKGYLSGNVCGKLSTNEESGLYGAYSSKPDFCIQTVPIGNKSEIRNGDAVLLSGVSGSVKEYAVKLSDVGKNNDAGSKNFIVTVTDPALLELTGGIVQGMSGSPILQDGKLVGAVTHVLINDPQKGYGILIENMLRNMPSARSDG